MTLDHLAIIHSDRVCRRGRMPVTTSRSDDKREKLYAAPKIQRKNALPRKMDPSFTIPLDQRLLLGDAMNSTTHLEDRAGIDHSNVSVWIDILEDTLGDCVPRITKGAE